MATSAWSRREGASRLNGPLLLLLLTSLVAACGGGSATPGVASLGSKATSTSVAVAAGGRPGPPVTSGQVETDLLRYASCMQTHGEPDYPSVPYEHPSAVAKIDQNSPQYLAATRACRNDLPKGAPTASPAEQAAIQAKALKFAHCMQTHGMPTWPDPSTNGGFQAALGGPAANSPVYLRALKTCKPLFP